MKLDYYVLLYKDVPLAYAFTRAEVEALTKHIPLSLDWKQTEEMEIEDLRPLPYVGSIPSHVWSVFAEIDLKKIQKMT